MPAKCLPPTECEASPLCNTSETAIPLSPTKTILSPQAGRSAPSRFVSDKKKDEYTRLQDGNKLTRTYLKIEKRYVPGPHRDLPERAEHDISKDSAGC